MVKKIILHFKKYKKLVFFKNKDLIGFITTIEQMTSLKESLDSKFANIAKNKMVKMNVILETKCNYFLKK